MNSFKATDYLEKNEKYLFPNKEFTKTEVMAVLTSLPEEKDAIITQLPLRNPKLALVLSFLFTTGTDHFYLGKIGKGLVKCFTFGGFGIWGIIDIFSATNRCRTYNCKNLMSAISDPAVVEKLVKQNEMFSKGMDTAKKYAPVAKEVVKGAKDVRDGFFVN